jgi:hypothetical protein
MMNPTMFRNIEDGTEEPREVKLPGPNGGTVAALELGALEGLSFAGIFDWAKSAAKQVGAATKLAPPSLAPSTQAGPASVAAWQKLRVNAKPTGKLRPASAVADQITSEIDRENGTALTARSPKAMVRADNMNPVGAESDVDTRDEIATWLSGYPGYMHGLGFLLGETDPATIQAKEKLMASKDAGYMDPRALLTESGAAEIAVTAAKAETAAKLHQSRAGIIANKVKRLTDDGRREKDPNRQNQMAAEALDWTRRLATESAAAVRSATVAGGLQVALEHRNASKGALTKAGAEDALGKAASALVQTQQYAKTPVRVALPEELTQNYIERLRTGVALSGLGSFGSFGAAAARIMKKSQHKPVGASDLTQSSRALSKIGARTPAPWPRAGSAVPTQLRARETPAPQFSHPSFKAGIPSLNMPSAQFETQYSMDDQNPGFEGSLYGLGVVNMPQTYDGLNGLGGIFDSIVSAVKSIVPRGTIVGDLIGSTTPKGQGLLQQVGITSPGGAGPKPANPTERGVLNQIAAKSDSILSSTGGQIGLVAVVGGLGILAVVLLARRRAA